ncbi:hypothetical protein KVR01_002946 [Diaporthe batatas]|uniref:uncharacterized protein n=1 Tax=Diaporthe batatas TaxID=748121 RepID=UPI001D038D35|nr:uncharacterized protein KVR01_002946 [Diaporthe batatas]KAG8167257.1 hypothetical protein KVR01_002946 [Diaporthe batatas]
MRSGHVFYSLCAAAPLAMATPVLPHLVLVKTLEETASDPSSGPIGYQPPATITTAGAKGVKTEVIRPLNRQSIMLDDGGGGDDVAREPAFDNRPLSASASDLSRLASEVLSSAGPLSSDLLEALARLQSGEELTPTGTGAGPRVGDADTETRPASKPKRPESSPRRKMSVGSLVRLASNRDGGVLRIKQHAGDSAALGQPQPCVAGHHTDVLVIGMVLTFLLVVLMMETWQPVSRSVRRILSREGAIRLQDDVEKVRTMSHRAPGLDIPETIDEKPEEECDDNVNDGGAEPWVI